MKNEEKNTIFNHFDEKWCRQLSMYIKELNYFLLACTSLFTMINPFGVMPIYLNYTQELNHTDAKNMAKKATLTAFIIMVIFALTGHFIFKFFSISLDALKVVGGVLFFLMGYDMLQAKPPRTKMNDENEADFHHEVALTPLGIPMICGPGTITIVILMNQQAQTYKHQILLFISMALISFVTFLFLIGSKRLMNAIGPSGNKVMFRIMGLIMMVIAVEYFFSGLRPLLNIPPLTPS